MGDIRDYTWAFPIVGGALALIALLTPAAYISIAGDSIYVWMWGLISIQSYGYGSATQFTEDPGELIISIICSLLVLISTIVIISKGNSIRTYPKLSKSWVAPSILLIIGTIVWMVGMEINSIVFYGISLWALINPGFGVIGMFLGGALSLIGYGVSKISPKEAREVIIPMKKEFMRSENGISQPSEASVFKFCPNCGYKIIKVDNRFCTNCGFELKGLP